jgi:hypothetical protein
MKVILFIFGLILGEVGSVNGVRRMALASMQQAVLPLGKILRWRRG